MNKLLGILALAALVSSASAQVPSRSRSASASAPAPAPRATSSPTFSAPTSSRTNSASNPSYRRSRGMDNFGSYRGNRVSVFPNPRYPTFTGRVTTQGGGRAPVEPIRATCNCGGRFYDLGYLRFGSGFQFGFGYPYGLPTLQPWMYRSGCNLLLYAPGYRMMSLPLSLDPTYGMGYYNSIGKIRMEPYEDVARVSFTSYTAPKEAKKAYEKGAKKFIDDKLLDAKTLLLTAVDLHPEYAAAWTMLGRTFVRLGENQAARDAFERSLAADADYVAPYRPLVRILMNQKDWEGAAEVSQKGIDLNPYDAELKYQLSVTAMELGDFELARDMAERVFSTDDGVLYPESGYVLAKAYRKLGQPRKAIQAYEEYLERHGKPEVRRWARTDLQELLAQGLSEASSKSAAPR